MEHIWVIIGLFFKLVCKFGNFWNKMLRVGGGGNQTGHAELGKQTQPAAEALLALCGQAIRGQGLSHCWKWSFRLWLKLGRARGQGVGGPAAALHPPPLPILERSAFQASRRSLSLGRLEQGAFSEVQGSLPGRWLWSPGHWDKHAFVFVPLSFWSLVQELLLVPISKCSCSNFSPLPYFCCMMEKQLSGPRDNCGIWRDVCGSQAFLGCMDWARQNRANNLGMLNEGASRRQDWRVV